MVTEKRQGEQSVTLNEGYAIVWKKSNSVVKWLLVVLIVFSAAALAALGWVHAGIRAQTQELSEQVLEMEIKNQALERRIDAIGTEQSIRQIASEELGMVSGNAVLIQPE